MGFSVTFSLNLTADDLKRVIDDEVREYASEEFYRESQEYVPYKTGALMNTVRVDKDGVHYLQPYASSVYLDVNPMNGRPYNFSKDIHPKATSYWDEAFVLDKYDAFLKKIEQFIRDRKL